MERDVEDLRHFTSWRCVLSRLVFFRKQAREQPASSSLSTDRLSPHKWLTVIRRHWAVETTHQVLDVTFQEDEHPWVIQNPRLTATIMILHRIGNTLLSIFKHITQRSDHRRQEPWRVLLTRMHCACGALSLSLGP